MFVYGNPVDKMLKSGYRTNGIEQDKKNVVQTDGNNSTENRRNNNNNNSNNNNNNSYIALYSVKDLRARGAVHYQHQNPLDNQKSTSTINAYIHQYQHDKKPG